MSTQITKTEPTITATPTLTDEDLIVGQDGSEATITAKASYNRAKEALAQADATKLFKLYEQAVRERNEIDKLYCTSMALFIGKKDKQPVSENAIESMERIALAAIDLAKHVAGIKD